jgi:hypothetical protein
MEMVLILAGAFLGISIATLLAVRNGQTVIAEQRIELQVSREWLAANTYTRGTRGDND